MTLAHPKIKPPPKAEERKKLKKFEFGFLIIQQDGKCGCGCGQKLDFSKPGMVIDEHLISLQMAALTISITALCIARNARRRKQRPTPER